MHANLEILLGEVDLKYDLDFVVAASAAGPFPEGFALPLESLEPRVHLEWDGAFRLVASGFCGERNRPDHTADFAQTLSTFLAVVIVCGDLNRSRT